MQAGDTFTIQGVADRHLWVIISDPETHPDRVVFASFTSFDVTKDASCVIEAGEHPFVQHRTCIAYFDIKEAPLTNLEHLRDLQRIQMRTPVESTLLDRIRQGVSRSREIPFKFVELLIEQGVID